MISFRFLKGCLSKIHHLPGICKIAAGLIILSCAGCAIVGDPFSSKNPPMTDWMNAWIDSPTCQIPCWEGLTPGITKLIEGADHIKGLPYVASVRYPLTEFKSREKDITWNFIDQKGGGWAQSDELGETINQISIRLANVDFPLKKIIDGYGAPDRVILNDCRREPGMNFCVTYLVYDQKGMTIVLFLKDIGFLSKDKVNIKPETQIFEIALYSINDVAEYVFSLWNPRSVSDWEGYKTYP
jgi:hypothetical protein